MKTVMGLVLGASFRFLVIYAAALGLTAGLTAFAGEQHPLGSLSRHKEIWASYENQKRRGAEAYAAYHEAYAAYQSALESKQKLENKLIGIDVEIQQKTAADVAGSLPRDEFETTPEYTARVQEKFRQDLLPQIEQLKERRVEAAKSLEKIHLPEVPEVVQDPDKIGYKVPGVENDRFEVFVQMGPYDADAEHIQNFKLMPTQVCGRVDEKECVFQFSADTLTGIDLHRDIAKRAREASNNGQLVARFSATSLTCHCSSEYLVPRSSAEIAAEQRIIESTEKSAETKQDWKNRTWALAPG